jgi:hypothetical protein
MPWGMRQLPEKASHVGILSSDSDQSGENVSSTQDFYKK